MFFRYGLRFQDNTPPTGGAPGEPPTGGAPNPGGSGTGAKPPESGTGGDDSGEPDFESLDPKTKKYIKTLRDENAKHRKDVNKLTSEFEGFKTKLKGVFGDDEGSKLTPEQQVEQLSAQFEESQVQNAILSQAIVHGIPADGLEYFQFKINGAVDKLEEGEELSEEAFAAIVADVRAKTGKPSSGATSPAPGSQGAPPPKGGDDGLTVEKFAASLNVQNELYLKDPQRYLQLKNEAQSKGLYNKR